MAEATATLGVVDLRPGRQPVGWPMARRLGGRSVLELIVRGVTDCQRVGKVVVVADPGDQSLVTALVPPDVPVWGSFSGDLLATYVALADQHAAGALVCVRADYPFVDPVLIDRLVSAADEFPGGDYLTYCLRDGRTAVHSALGLFGHWCSVAALRIADNEATHEADRRDPLRYVASRPDRFGIRLLRVPPELDRDDVRLCLRREEDWEFAQTIYDALGPERLAWQEIAGLLSENPDLRERMKVFNRSEPAG